MDAMDAMDIKGKSIDEAIENACNTFQVPREKLNIEILCEAAPGFLGLGSKKARIRASLLKIDLSLDAPLARPESKVGSRVSEQNRRGAQPEMRVASGTAASAAPVCEPRPAPIPAASEAEPSPEKARRFLEALLKHMQIPSPVNVQETPESIILNIDGDGSGLLIGKRGQNLDAIQYIVNKAVHHSVNGHRMIVIDTESYRQRREEALIAMAMRAAEKVRKNKKPMTIGHMNAHDRRIIHLAIQNDATLTTKSRGEGEYRNILILPARRGPEQAGS
jgi:spoIIIJ-associated protein